MHLTKDERKRCVLASLILQKKGRPIGSALQKFALRKSTA